MPSHYIHLKRCQKGEDVYSLKNDVYKNNTAHTAQGRIKAGTTGTDGTRPARSVPALKIQNSHAKFHGIQDIQPEATTCGTWNSDSVNNRKSMVKILRAAKKMCVPINGCYSSCWTDPIRLLLRSPFTTFTFFWLLNSSIYRDKLISKIILWKLRFECGNKQVLFPNKEVNSFKWF